MDIDMGIDPNTKNSLTREETMSMISHELRTSLTASKWMLEMLQDGDVGDLTLSQKEVISKLLSSNSRMMEVATNLLTLSKASSHEGEYNMQELDLSEIIDSVIFELGGEAFRQHIELIYIKPDQELPKIKADESKLRIVFQNLIDNAVKYSNGGSRVVISTTKEENLIKISVKDTGIGIDVKDLPSITSEFYRAPNASRKISTGSGIGLYICKRIIEGHNGEMTIDSQINKGTVITINLPISN